MLSKQEFYIYGKTYELYKRIRIYHILFVKRMLKFLDWHNKIDLYNRTRIHLVKKWHIKKQLADDIQTLREELDFIAKYPLNDENISDYLMDKYWITSNEVDKEVDNLIPNIMRKIINKGFTQMNIVSKLLDAIAIEFMNYLKEIYIANSLNEGHKRNLRSIDDFKVIISDVVNKLLD